MQGGIFYICSSYSSCYELIYAIFFRIYSPIGSLSEYFMFLHLDQTSGNTAKHTPPELAVKLPKLVEPAPLPYEAAEKDAATSSLTADATGKHMDQVTNEGTTAGLSAAGDGSVAATTTRPSQQLPDIPDDHT